MYVNSNTELHELLRLPVLFEHFNEQRQRIADLGLWDFLVMHYTDNASHDEHDTGMPFKDRGHSFVAPTLTVCAQKFVLIQNISELEITHSSIYTEAFVASSFSEIFQPPRI